VSQCNMAYAGKCPGSTTVPRETYIFVEAEFGGLGRAGGRITYWLRSTTGDGNVFFRPAFKPNPPLPRYKPAK